MAIPHLKLTPLSGEDIVRFWSTVKVLGPDDCWKWTGNRGGGYGHFKIDNVWYAAHRLAYYLSFGIDPEHLLVCHRCDRGPCCNPAHLFLGTYADNSKDAQRKGRLVRGSEHKNAKLTESNVKTIRELRQNGVTIAALAVKFNVSKACICAIIYRHKWKHVRLPEDP